MKITRPLTPAEMSPALSALCNEICPGKAPVYIDVRANVNAPQNECFALVEQQVSQEGGTEVIGWELWEQPGIFVEAEFHSVWRKPDGTLIDIAPKQSERILFLEDPSKVYEGRQVDNIRRAIKPDPIIIGYLQTLSERFELMNRGSRADQHGEITLIDDEAEEYDKIQKRLFDYDIVLSHRFQSFGPYSPCWCGSGKKIKWCHGVTSIDTHSP